MIKRILVNSKNNLVLFYNSENYKVSFIFFDRKKSIEMKEKIKLLAKDFGGNLKDIQVIELLKISRNTYFKYKRELKEEL